MDGKTTMCPHKHHRWEKLPSPRVVQVALSVQRLDTGWTIRGSNPGGGEIFRTCPDRPWGPPSLLYNGYRVFPGGKERTGRDADPSSPSNAVGHERVELYLYSPCGPYGPYRASVSVQGCTLAFFFHLEHGSMSDVGLELLSSPSNPERLNSRTNTTSVPLNGANGHNKIPVSTS